MPHGEIQLPRMRGYQCRASPPCPLLNGPDAFPMGASPHGLVLTPHISAMSAISGAFCPGVVRILRMTLLVNPGPRNMGNGGKGRSGSKAMSAGDVKESRIDKSGSSGAEVRIGKCSYRARLPQSVTIPQRLFLQAPALVLPRTFYHQNQKRPWVGSTASPEPSRRQCMPAMSCPLSHKRDPT